MGTKDEVVAIFNDAIPGIQWHEEPPLIDQINSIPDHPFKDLMHTWPKAMRENAMKPKLTALVETDGFSIIFYGFECDPIQSVGAEVRGNGNPVPMHCSLCKSSNWSLKDDARRSFIDVESESAPGWDEFRDYRDRVIEEIDRDGSRE